MDSNICYIYDFCQINAYNFKIIIPIERHDMFFTPESFRALVWNDDKCKTHYPAKNRPIEVS